MIISKNIPIKRTFASIVFFVLAIYSYGQRGNRFPVWTFHEKDVDIHGISVGLLSTVVDERSTNTNGIRLELIGLGVFVPLIPDIPTFEEQYSERINGLSLSTLGTVGNCLVNGLSVGAFGQINYQVNGISFALMMSVVGKVNGVAVAGINYADSINGLQLGASNSGLKTKGVQIGFIGNEIKEMRGIQIGGYNRSGNLRGIQIGLWNVNQKRKLPLINWNFRRTAKKEMNEQQ